MKKSFVVVGLLASALAFTACSSSSSSSSKSLADACAAGISEECLTSGVWNMNAFYTQNEAGAYEAAVSLSSPTKLVFSDTGTFELTYSTDPDIQSEGTELLGAAESGTWTLVGNVLTMNVVFGTDTFDKPIVANATVTATALGGFQLNLGGVVIHKGAFPAKKTAGIFEIFDGVDLAE